MPAAQGVRIAGHAHRGFIAARMLPVDVEAARDSDRGTGLRIPDVFAALALFVAALAVRLHLMELYEISSDSGDPLRNVLRLLSGERSALRSDLPFGYGRELSYLPLFAARDWGLTGVGALRALAQAACAPALYCAIRLSAFRRGGGAAGVAFLGAAALVASPGLLRTYVSGHETYLAVEWVCLSMVLVSGFRRRSTALVAAGLSLAMAVSNHPTALAAVPCLGFLAWSSGREKAYRLLAGLGLGLLPLAVSAAPAVGSGLLSHWRATAPHGSLGFTALVQRLLGPEAAWEPVVVLAGLSAACLFAERRRRRLLMATGFGFGLVIAFAAVTQHASPWHWRPLLPAALLALALAPSKRIAHVGVSLFLAGLTVVGGWGFSERAGNEAEQIGQAGVAATVAAAARTEGPFTLAGYLDMPSGSRSDFLGVGIDLALRGAAESLVLDRSQMSAAPALIYFEGEPQFIAQVAASASSRDWELLGRGRRLALFRGSDAASARGLGSLACQAARHGVTRIGAYDALSVLAPQVRWVSDVSPAEHPCSAETPWVSIEPPPDPESLRAHLRQLRVEFGEAPLNTFEIRRFEIRWSEVLDCRAAGACKGSTKVAQSPDHPALVGLSEAKEFCGWRDARLPTLMDWSRAAARWDSKGSRYTPFPWGDGAPDGRAMLQGGLPREPGGYPSGATDAGVEDLVGNVSEWVLDAPVVACGAAGVPGRSVGLVGGDSLGGIEGMVAPWCRAVAQPSDERGGIRCVR
jgi:hypothetical protein